MPDASAFGVVLFHTSSAALRAEKKLIAGGLTVKLIPTPRDLSSDCGIALRFDWNQADQVRVLLEAAHVEIEALHRTGN
jgi:hypothetical protein